MGAARAGFDRAAQTLLGAALTHHFEHSLNKRLGAAYKQFSARDLDEASRSDLRLACLELSSVDALTDTKLNPPGFNRHGSQHGSPARFSEPAMLGAALLVAGWLRELSWLCEHRPEIVKDVDD